MAHAGPGLPDPTVSRVGKTNSARTIPTLGRARWTLGQQHHGQRKRSDEQVIKGTARSSNRIGHSDESGQNRGWLDAATTCFSASPRRLPPDGRKLCLVRGTKRLQSVVLISVTHTRFTFQNSGPVNSNFPARLLR